MTHFKKRTIPFAIYTALFVFCLWTTTALADGKEIRVYSTQPGAEQTAMVEALLPQLSQDLQIILLENSIAVNECFIGQPFELNSTYGEKNKYMYPVIFQDTIIMTVAVNFQIPEDGSLSYNFTDALVLALENSGGVPYFFKSSNVYWKYIEGKDITAIIETPILERIASWPPEDRPTVPSATVNILEPLFPLTDYADETPRIPVYIDGQLSDIPAYFINGSYFVPARSLEELSEDITLAWNGASKTLTLYATHGKWATKLIFTRNRMLNSTYDAHLGDDSPEDAYYYEYSADYAPMYIIGGRAMVPADTVPGFVKATYGQNRLDLLVMESNSLREPSEEYIGAGAWTHINQSIEKAADWRQIVTDTAFPLGAVSSDDRNGQYGSYPRIDGSTVNVPMGMEFAMQHLNMTLEDAASFTAFSTTHYAYEKLITQTLDWGNSSAIESLRAYMQEDKPVDIILVTEPSEEELALAKEHDVELIAESICYDAFVFITHKDNPVESLTVEQIQKIYSGEITNWKEVGGPELPIIPYQREVNSGSQTAMENMVMKDVPMLSPYDEDYSFNRIPIVFGMGSLVYRVGQYQNSAASIGYTYKYYIDNLYKDENIKILNINGIAPEDENLYNNTYPFYTHYYGVIRKGDENATGGKFLQWLLSEEGQQCIKQTGYVPMAAE